MRTVMISFVAVLMIAATSGLARASDDANMKVVNSFAMDVINAHDVTAVDRLFAADCREHTPMGTNTGSDAFKGFASAIFSAFPNVQVTYTPLSSVGDLVTVYGHVTATHQGELFGIPATGKQVAWTEFHVFRIVDGKIAEHWVEANLFGLMQQIQGGS